MPVSQMGNYQEYLKRMPSPLREVESTPVRQHMFGNPFKIDKRMMVDEADIDLVSSGSPHRGGCKRGPSEAAASPRLTNKRKPGPIPRDLVVRRPSSPVCPSPAFLSPSPEPISEPYSPPPLLTPPPLSPAINGEIDELGSLSREDCRARSPSPPPLQPYDEIPPDLPPSLGPPPLTLMEDDNSIDWQPIDNPQVFQNHSSHSSAKLNASKPHSDLLLSKAELAEIQRHNRNVRTLAYKEVRRPGINYTPLFSHLEQMKGSVDDRANLLKDIINESLRFKRRKLANLLEQFMKTLLADRKGINGER